MQFRKNKKIIIFVLVTLLLAGINFGIKIYVTEESKCSSNEHCKDFSCPDEVGKDIPKCDPNTETCYCGGECGDGYCNDREESLETCPEDCKVKINLCPMSDAPESAIGCPIGKGYPDPDYPLFGYTSANQLIAHSVFDEEDGEYMLLKKDDELSITISDVAKGQYHVIVKAMDGSCSGQFMFGETVDFIIDTETKSYNLNLQSAGFDMKITNGECNVDMIKIEEIKEEVIDCKKEFGPEYWCSDIADWETECQGKGTYKKIEGVCNTAGQNYCVTCKEEPKLVDCKEEYGEGYWCADYNLWETECQGKGDVKELTKPCNEKGDKYCVTCVEEIVTFVEKKGCSSCGTGLMNICDEEECNGLGNCVYKDSLVGGECLEVVEIELVMIDDESIEEGQELTTEGEFIYTVEIKCNKPEGCGDVSVSLKTEIEK